MGDGNVINNMSSVISIHKVALCVITLDHVTLQVAPLVPFFIAASTFNPFVSFSQLPETIRRPRISGVSTPEIRL